MSFSAAAADERVLDVAFTDDALSVSLRDGRIITVPIVWYPRLLNATPEQRQNWKIAGGGYGLHWPDLDEDLSTEGLLRGAPAPKAPEKSISTQGSVSQVISAREQSSENRYGYGVGAWEGAKAEAVKEISAQARRESTITYTDLTKRIHSIAFGPSDYAFHYLLYEISVEEDGAGRGLLSALVVRKEDGMPGDGFFDLAQKLGRDITDRVRCWTEEIRLVFSKWH
jgi:hypothetical protein